MQYIDMNNGFAQIHYVSLMWVNLCNFELKIARGYRYLALNNIYCHVQTDSVSKIEEVAMKVPRDGHKPVAV